MDLPTTKSVPSTDIHDYTFLFHGVPKIGKTSLCAHFDGAMFIATEPGHKFQEIFKVDVKNWDDIRSVATKLIKEEHNFKTIVFDTADNAYKMCVDYVNRKNNISHESDLSFGKAYTMIKEEFMRVVIALGQSGLGLVFISHSTMKEIEDKGMKKNYITTTLPNGIAKVISGLCDFILYCHYDQDSNRKIRLIGTDNINAGLRGVGGKLIDPKHSGIPDVIDLDFDLLRKTIEGKTKQTNKTEEKN